MPQQLVYEDFGQAPTCRIFTVKMPAIWLSPSYGCGMSAGSSYGAEQAFGSRKWVIIAGNLGTFFSLMGLRYTRFKRICRYDFADLCGIFGMSFPLMMAHGRSFIPPHVMGRGVAMLNLCSISGVGILQSVSASAYQWGAVHSPAAGYQSLFLFFAIPLVITSIIYMFIQDRLD